MATRPAAAPRFTVRADPEGHVWWFAGRVRRLSDGGVVIHPDDLASCRAADLQRALRRLADTGAFDGMVLISATDEAYMGEDGAPVAPVSFSLHEGHLALDIAYVSDDYEDDGVPTDHTTLVQPVMARTALTVLDWSVDDGYASRPWLWRACFRCPTRGRSLLDLFNAGSEMMLLLEAASSSELTRESVAGLVRGSHLSALVGQPEGHWLDVKTQHYDLSGPAGRISLAQSVSRFANAEDGGVVVVGMSAKRVAGGEEIRGVTPLPLDRGMVRRYHQALDERVFPPVYGLTVEHVTVDGGMVILIDVPPQPEELKPFLVHGAIVDGRVEGTFISIVRRRGEASIPMTAPMIHAQLAAGRALLRGATRPGAM
jgi:schlafen family protein